MGRLTFVVSVFVVACSNPNPNPIQSDVGSVDLFDMSQDKRPFDPPSVHRAASETCDSQRLPGDGTELVGDCADDSDCIGGLNGRCHASAFGNICSYDACLEDSDCNGGICGCSLGQFFENVCLEGNCQTDADCPETGFCSPTYGDCHELEGYLGMYCHTERDECFSDSDCPDNGDGTPFCMRPENGDRWICVERSCDR